jgi:hypothetical protein
MEKLDIKEKLKNDYAIEETKIKKLARGTLSSFLGIDIDNVSVGGAGPHEKGVRVYLKAGDFDFVYNHPSGKIEFSMDGNLYDVGQRSDIGRIITFKENKLKQ